MRSATLRVRRGSTLRFRFQTLKPFNGRAKEPFDFLRRSYARRTRCDANKSKLREYRSVDWRIDLDPLHARILDHFAGLQIDIFTHEREPYSCDLPEVRLPHLDGRRRRINVRMQCAHVAPARDAPCLRIN